MELRVAVTGSREADLMFRGDLRFNIFEHDPISEAARLSESGLQSADEHDCMRKNSRDDRFTLLAVPETDVALPVRSPPLRW